MLSLRLVVRFCLITWVAAFSSCSNGDVDDDEALETGQAALTGDEATVTKKVMVINLDPITPTGQRLSQYRNWNSPHVLVDGLVQAFAAESSGYLQYQVVRWVDIDAFPRKADGFTYTFDSYIAVLADEPTHHVPDDIDRLGLLAATQACELANADEIDEIWVYGGPWFGLYESQLMGPRAFGYNSPPLRGTTCNRLIPMMGLSYKEGLDQAIHSFGHREEATMASLYGGWSENDISTPWNRYGLVAVQSPAFGYSGCGSIHFAPNSTQAYQYDAPQPGSYTCPEFANFPNLSPVPVQSPLAGCQEWGCSGEGYFRWWFRHLPRRIGVRADDGKLANWWAYFAEPELTLPPPSQNVPMPMPVRESARVAIEQPASGASLSDKLRIRGWAADFTAQSGRGVDAVKVYARFTPPTASGGGGAGGPNGPTKGEGVAEFIGDATYGLSSSANAAAHGEQFKDTGWKLNYRPRAHPAGVYSLFIEACAHSIATDGWVCTHVAGLKYTFK